VDSHTSLCLHGHPKRNRNRKQNRFVLIFTRFVNLKYSLLLCPGRGVVYCDHFVCLCVCLPASISLEPLDRSSQNFLCRSPVAVAQSSSGCVAICYVLPVLWMTPCLAVMGHMATSGVAILGRSLLSMNAFFNLEIGWPSPTDISSCSDTVQEQLICYTAEVEEPVVDFVFWADSR